MPKPGHVEVVPSININYGYMEQQRSERARRGVVHIDFMIGYGTSSLFLDEIQSCIEAGIKDIKVVINSPGGAVYESLVFHDILASLPTYGVTCTAYVLGVAASAAAMLVLQGAQNRVSAPNSEFMIHELQSQSDGFESVSTQEDQTRFQKRLQDKMLGVLARRTGKSIAFWSKLITRKATWLNAEEAKKHGLIDEIGSFPLK